MNGLWDQLAAAADTPLSPQQHDLLARYLDLLLAANATMNLTRLTDRAAAETGHVGDALTLLPLLPNGPFTLADVGSGGGVPGIPLAIARPDASVVLIESTGKKARFLQRAIADLGLKSVSVQACRAEDVGRGPLRESFDIVTARAVGSMPMLVEWCLPLLRIGGQLLAMKGQRLSGELPLAARAIRLLGGGEPSVHPVPLPGAEHHAIVQIPKVLATPARYPRHPSQAKGRPLA